MTRASSVSILLRLGPSERAALDERPAERFEAMEPDHKPTHDASHRQSMDTFRGLELLDGNDEASLDVIFVHGLGDSWRHTWSKVGESNPWPGTLLRKDIPEVRVFVGGFDILKEDHSFQRLCKRFSDELKQSIEKSQNPFIFIAHSLGCLIALWAIVNGLSSSELELLKCIIFFAPPLFRNEENEWANFEKKISYTGNQWSSLVDEFRKLNQEFMERKSQKPLGGIKIYSFFERLATRRFGILVPESRVPDIFDESRGILSTHAEMPRFSSRINPDYEIMTDWIKMLIDIENDIFEDDLTQCSAEDTDEDQSETQISDFSDGREILADSGTVVVDARRALALEDHGHYRDAEHAYRSAVEQCTGNDSKQGILMFLQERLAVLLGNRGYYTEANKLGEDVFSQRAEMFGFHDPRLLASAALFCSIGRHISHGNNAFLISKQVIASYTGSKDYDAYILAYSKLLCVHATLLRDNGHLEVAILLFRDALGLCSLLKLGTSVVYIALQKVEMALAFLLLDRASTAERMAIDAHKALQQKLGPRHPDTLYSALILAMCERLRADYPPALQKLEEINRCNTGRLADGSSSLLLTRRELATVYAIQEFYGEAVEIFEDILSLEVDNSLTTTQGSFDWIQKAVNILKPLSTSTTSDLNKEKAKIYLQGMPLPQNHLDLHVSAQYKASKPLESTINFFSDKLVDSLTSNDIQTIDYELVNDFKVRQRMLLAAAASNNLEVLSQLLERGVDVNSTNEYYGTALQAAACAGHLHIVQTLLNKQADTNIKCGIFGTALRGAVIHGNIRIVTLLIQKGADPNLRNEGTASPLQMAILKNDVGLVKALLRSGAVDINADDYLFRDPLQEACTIGDPDIVDLLLKYGANTASIGGLFEKSIQAAEYSGHFQIVQKLTDKHFGINTTLKVTNFDDSYGISFSPSNLPSILREKTGKGEIIEPEVVRRLRGKRTRRKKIQQLLNTFCCLPQPRKRLLV